MMQNIITENRFGDGKIIYTMYFITYIYTNNLTSSMHDIKFMLNVFNNNILS